MPKNGTDGKMLSVPFFSGYKLYIGIACALRQCIYFFLICQRLTFYFDPVSVR